MTNKQEDSLDPRWSPDKTRIVFLSNMNRVDGGSDIFVMNADGSDLTQLTNHPTRTADRGPVWSPDGSKIAFYSFERDGDVQNEIYVMNADGSNQQRLTTSTLNEGPLDW